MSEIRHATRKKAYAVFTVIIGMIFTGSFLIGSVDITKNTNNTVPSADVDNVRKTYSSTIISDELASFFDSFDINHDGRLQLGEAKNFYYWVEKNIEYRTDGESASLIPSNGNLQVINGGDGRSGSDYRQTPTETLEERAGDCEDMATLEVAFFNFYGIEAYVVAVNAKDPSVPDHALAVARLQDFHENVGPGLMGYTFTNAERDVYGNSVSPGTYIIVDNAYASTFGHIDGKPEEGKFEVHCFIPLEHGYGSEWSMVVSKCQ